MRMLAAGSELAPTLFTACNALPPEGAHFALGRPGGETFASTLPTSCGSLPPEGANFPWGGPAENSAHTFPNFVSLSAPRGGGPCLGRPG